MKRYSEWFLHPEWYDDGKGKVGKGFTREEWEEAKRLAEEEINIKNA